MDNIYFDFYNKTTDLLYLKVVEQLSQPCVLLGDLREGGQAPDHPVHRGVVDLVQSPHLIVTSLQVS